MTRRILLLITDLEIGGTPTVVRELATRLRKPGRVEVEVACLSRWGPVAEELKSAGVTVTPLNAHGIHSLPVTLFRLVRLIRNGRFDTVFSFLVHANLMAAFAARFFDDARFLQSIQTTQPNPRWHWWAQELATSGADLVVVASPSAATVARRWAAVSRDKLLIIPNAVDASVFPRSPIPEGSPRPYPVGFIGRLDPVKRIPDLLQAAAALGGLIELHLFGAGPERSRIEAEICRLGIESMVHMHGVVARPQLALEQIGLLVLPSIAEGFGLVLIEAMAARVPVVATDVPGIRDVVRHGENGLLVPPGDPRDLAAAIRQIVEDGTLRRRLLDRAAQDVRDRFGWDKAIARYRQALDL